MMDAFHNRYASKLRDALEAEEAERTKALATTIAPDHSAYTNRVGFILGLRRAAAIAQDVDHEMSRDEGHIAPEAARRQIYES